MKSHVKDGMHFLRQLKYIRKFGRANNSWTEFNVFDESHPIDIHLS